MHTVTTQTNHLIAKRDAMWFAGAAKSCSVQVAATVNKVRATIRPATTGGPAGGVS